MLELASLCTAYTFWAWAKSCNVVGRGLLCSPDFVSQPWWAPTAASSLQLEPSKPVKPAGLQKSWVPGAYHISSTYCSINISRHIQKNKRYTHHNMYILNQVLHLNSTTSPDRCMSTSSDDKWRTKSEWEGELRDLRATCQTRQLGHPKQPSHASEAFNSIQFSLMDSPVDGQHFWSRLPTFILQALLPKVAQGEIWWIGIHGHIGWTEHMLHHVAS